MPKIDRFWKGQNAFIKRDKEVTQDFCIYQGGFGCVDGDTLLTLASGAELPIKDFTGGYIVAWDGEGLIPAYATKPALYDKRPLYRVATNDGQSIVCTSSHRFLTPWGWKETGQLHHGDEILTSPNDLGSELDASCLALGLLSWIGPLQTSSAHGLSTRVEDGCDSLQTLQDCLVGCLAYPHLYDERPLLGLDSDPEHSPLPSDAREHTHYYYGLGGQDSELNDNRSYQWSDPHSMTGFLALTDPLVSSQGLYCVDDSTFEPLLGSSQRAAQFLSRLTLEQLARVSSRPSPSLFDISYKNHLTQNLLDTSVIKSIEYVKTDYYYDLHVPGYNNYLAQGFINHNSGKTFVGSYLGQRLNAKYPGITGLVIGKTYPLIRDTTLRTHFEILEGFGLKRGRHWKYNKSEHLLVLHCFGDSEIFFRHLQDPEAIKSLNVGWIHKEECSQLDEDDENMLAGRLRQKVTKHGQVIDCLRNFGTTNPSPTKGFIAKQYVDKDPRNRKVVIDSQTREELSEEFVEGSDRKTYVYDETDRLLDVIQYRRIISPTTDNLALPMSYIQSMKEQFDAEYYKIYVLGQDGDYRAGLVCANWSSLNERPVQYDPNQPLHITCDFNVDPMCWGISHVVWGDERHPLRFEFFDELVQENTCTPDCIEQFIERYEDRRDSLNKAGIIINGDASGGSRGTLSAERNMHNYKIMENALAKAGFTKVKVDRRNKNPNPEHRIAAWQAATQNAEGVRRIYVNPDNCPQILHMMHNLKYRPGANEIAQPTRSELDSKPKLKFERQDMFDAISYQVELYAPVIIQKGKARKAPSHIDLGFDL